jgi:ParB family transcriptional regulator, chromosome partitioning protein
VRREWLTVLCSRRTPPKGSAGFVAGRLALGGHVLRRAMENPALLRSLLGLDGATDAAAVTKLVDGGSDGRAQVISLAVVLAAHEQATEVHSWRQPDEATCAYLTFLQSAGYELSPVERHAARLDTPKNRKPKAA